jgi:hypothetical protein
MQLDDKLMYNGQIAPTYGLKETIIFMDAHFHLYISLKQTRCQNFREYEG